MKSKAWIKKCMAIVCCLAAILQFPAINAKADDVQNPVVELGEYGDGDVANMDVTIQIASDFSVRIPKSVQAYDSEIEYTIGVKGAILKTESVGVVPEPSIEYELVIDDNIEDTVTATVSQTKQYWGSTEIDRDNWVETTGRITADEELGAGDWKSKLTFTISLGSINNNTELEPGLYDNDGNIVYSWQELKDIDIIKVEPEEIPGLDGTYQILSTNLEMPEDSYEAPVNHSAELLNGKLIISEEIDGLAIMALALCVNLNEVVLPEGLLYIGDSAFAMCTNITSIKIPNSVKTIGKQAFAGTSITTVELPDNITSIGDAFFSCESLTSITIPNSITVIEDGAFFRCISLTSIIIPDSVTTIEACAFEMCESLESVTLPNSLTSIGNMAFTRCTSLSEITLPDNIETIGEDVFIGCSNLATINYKGIPYTDEVSLEEALTLEGVEFHSGKVW